MDKNSLDELLGTLSFIALWKSLLPFGLRGWVNALGLHVQERKGGQWARLQAGGSFRSYLHAWREGEGDWQVSKLDHEMWEHRFAHVVDPTHNIAKYLFHATGTGGLDGGKGAILKEAIDHFKSTGEWLWLPGVVVDLKEISAQMAQLEPTELSRIIRHAESFRQGSKDPHDWWFLAMVYDLAARYKDFETNINTAYDLICSEYTGAEWMVWRWREGVAMLYFAAFSNSKLGQGVVVLGNLPSQVTASSLGYTIDEVRARAEESLERARTDARRAEVELGSLDEEETQALKQIEEAIDVCRNR